MALLAVNENGVELIVHTDARLARKDGEWTTFGLSDIICLPFGSIKKLIGRELTWEDEPVEYK